MRALAIVLSAAGSLSFALFLMFALRGCRDDSPTHSTADAGGSTASANSKAADSPEPNPSPSQGTRPSDEDSTPAAASESQPATSSDEVAAKRDASGRTAGEALNAAGRLAEEADEASSRDPGKAFQLAAEAYAIVAAFPTDPACSAMADRLASQLQDLKGRANAAAGIGSDGVVSKTLVER